MEEARAIDVGLVLVLRMETAVEGAIVAAHRRAMKYVRARVTMRRGGTVSLVSATIALSQDNSYVLAGLTFRSSLLVDIGSKGSMYLSAAWPAQSLQPSTGTANFSVAKQQRKKEGYDRSPSPSYERCRARSVNHGA
jgi:hypothetical protein